MVDLPNALLSDEPAAIVENRAGKSGIVLVCEHAGRQVPKALGTLGLEPAAMSTHIAWDLGAAALARALSTRLDAPLVLQRYSRLVFDCNRTFDAHDAIAEESDSVRIPANRDLPPAARQQRFDEIYTPFHNAVAEAIDGPIRRGQQPAVVSVHSFTPNFQGRERTLDLGVLHDDDARLADNILSLAEQDGGCTARRNEPYGPQDGVTHTLQRHGVERHLLNAMLEVRNDLISDADAVEQWAQRLEDLLTAALDMSLRPMEPRWRQSAGNFHDHR